MVAGGGFDECCVSSIVSLLVSFIVSKLVSSNSLSTLKEASSKVGFCGRDDLLGLSVEHLRFFMLLYETCL